MQEETWSSDDDEEEEGEGEEDEARSCWSKEEDALILSSVTQYGSRWGRIAMLLPRRTEHGVRNRYNRLMLLARTDTNPSPGSSC